MNGPFSTYFGAGGKELRILTVAHPYSYGLALASPSPKSCRRPWEQRATSNPKPILEKEKKKTKMEMENSIMMPHFYSRSWFPLTSSHRKWQPREKEHPISSVQSWSWNGRRGDGEHREILEWRGKKRGKSKLSFDTDWAARSTC